MVAGILAWLGTCTGVLALFSFADKAASLQGKARARALLDFGWKDTVTRWPSVFVEMFDSIFGRRHFTWRCFGRSCLFSATVVLICGLLWHSIRPEASSAWLAIAWEYPGWMGFLVVPAFVLINLIGDYCSLLQTRWLLRFCSLRPTVGRIGLFLVLDVAVTLLVFVATFSTVLGFYELTIPEHFLFDVEFYLQLITSGFLFDHPDSKLTVGPFLYSTYFTSVWLWLYALATFAGKLLLPILNRIEKGKKFFDLDKKPFLALGWLSVVIITVLFAVGAVVKACV